MACSPWPAESAVERLKRCKAMLAIHGVLTDSEKAKVERRIAKAEERLRRKEKA